MTSASPVLRIYVRRSKADKGHQEFSLDVQRDGARRFVAEDPRLAGADWAERVEYVDDGRAGDDFSRPGLQRLLAESQSGDFIVCRDNSRIGRDALETALAVRTLVRDRSAHVYYYASREEAKAGSAVADLMLVATGMGGAQELEAIRSRTREALRAKARAGRIAGGQCYGFTNVRQRDPEGRPFTLAKVDEEQAKVVLRIFTEFAGGAGYKSIAIRLNEAGITLPIVGRRGTGSWSPGAIRDILHRDRYRGVYVHGKINRRRVEGRRIVERARPEDVIRVEIPEWRIVPEELWERVQARFADTSARDPQSERRASYALSSIARCEKCGGAIGVVRTRLSGGVHVAAYGCVYNRQRGATVCPVTHVQDVAEVDAAMARDVRGAFLSPEVFTLVVDAAKARLRAPKGASPTAIETEIKRLRREADNLTTAIAAGGDIPTLLGALRDRQTRIRDREAALAAARRTPAQARAATFDIEGAVRKHLDGLAETLAGAPRARDAYRALFPDGIPFAPRREGRRTVWTWSGSLRLSVNTGGDPTGNRTRD